MRGRAIAPDEWKINGGDADGGPRTPMGFPSRGVTLLSWLPLNALPGDSEAGADCWGYTSSSGREYAIMCVHNGTSFIDVTDPVNPRVVGFVGGASSLWHDPTPWKTGVRPSRLGARFSCDAAVVGEYCYAASDVEGGSGIQIIDLRRIDDGVVKHVQNWSVGGLKSAQTLSADPIGRRLWACGSNIANGGLMCIDLADPENPVLAGAWTEQPVLDAFVFAATRGASPGRSLVACFAGGPAGGVEGGLVIVDATDPAKIGAVGRASYPGIASSRQGWTTEDQRYLYLGDALDGPAQGVPAAATRIFDIADPTAPKYLGWFTTTASTAIDHNQVVAWGRLCQANGAAGLRVLDLSEPTAPMEVAFFDTYPEDDEAKEKGAWGVYPLFSSGTILVSDMQRGLFVLRVDCPVDLDGDGEATPFDFAAFVHLFGAGDARADLSHDGVLDRCDFEEFQRRFQSGCDRWKREVLGPAGP